MSPETSPAVTFSSAIAWDVLAEACDRAGLVAEDAELVRLGQNAIFRLRRRPVIVRIGRSSTQMPIAERELCVARWLAGRSVPAARPVEDLVHLWTSTAIR
ncbi:hypothetical protein ACQPYA_13905 [Micromonospora sp. CA-263727]|uniref:hypothetical protein n=1 Tax=Micromonospora sp. CA-263727 TaxID=3239967 RepID=UPI003D8F8C4A